MTGSPILLHNICREFSPLATLSLSLHSSPFGSNQPVIPIAKTVTVARVASGFSTDRTYQPLFLCALRAYFENKKRLVKQGDIIAIGMDTDIVRRNSETNSKVEEAEHDDGPFDYT